MRTKFASHKVKDRSLLKEKVITDFRETKRITFEEHTYKGLLTVPNYPSFMPETAFKAIKQCYQAKSPHAAALYLLLLTQLQDKKQNNEVSLKQKDVAEYLELSVGTVNKAFQVLEDLGYITKMGHERYKLSPTVAWVGPHVEWAEELQAIQEGLTYVTRETETQDMVEL